MDEVQMIYEALTGNLIEQTPLLPPYLRLIIFQLFGKVTPFNMHIIPVVLGTITIVVSYVLGKEVDNRETGLLSAFFTTCNPVVLFYSREGRSYAALILATVLITLFYFRAYKYGRKNWLYYSVSLIAGALSHLLILHIAIAIALTSVLHFIANYIGPRHVKKELAQLVICSVITFLSAAIGFLYIINRPGVLDAASTSYSFGLLNYMTNVLMGLSTTTYTFTNDLFSLDVFLSLLYALGFLWGMKNLVQSGRFHHILYFFFLFLVPVVILYFTLGEKSSWPWGRYISFLVIPYFIIISLGINSIANNNIKKMAFFFFFIGLLPGFHKVTSLTHTYHSQYYSGQFSSIDEMKTKLDGVIIVSNADVNRVPMFYYLYKKNSLPVYLWKDVSLKLFKIEPQLSKIHTIDVPIAIKISHSDLPKGKYALLDWPELDPKSCDNLASITTSWSISSLTYQNRLRICLVH